MAAHLVVHPRAQAAAEGGRMAGRADLRSQVGHGIKEGLAPAQRGACHLGRRCAADLLVHQRLAPQLGDLIEQSRLERGDPAGIARVVEQQVEERGQVAGVRALRQGLAAQALAQFIEEGTARREAVVGQQRGHVHITPEGRQQGHDPRAPFGVVPQQAQHAGRAAVRLAAAHPVDQLDQPEVALDQGCAWVSAVEQGVDAQAGAGAGPPGLAGQGAKQGSEKRHQCRDCDRASVKGAIGASNERASSVMQ
jgi:hypothetical protein